MVVISVEPSTSASGCLVPSASTPRATTHRCSPKCTPSTINATSSSSPRGRASRSANAVSVAAMNLRDTADLLVAVAAASTPRPTGSRPTPYRRVDSPASIRSIAIRLNTSMEENSS